MKISMYELLGMIKDDKAPKKIKVGNKIYNYETFNIGKDDNYFTAEWEEVKGYRINYDGIYYYLEIRDYHLNDEVEILEEEKKIPEKLNKQHFHNRQRQLANKINKIIDYLDYLESKGE